MVPHTFIQPPILYLLRLDSHPPTTLKRGKLLTFASLFSPSKWICTEPSFLLVRLRFSITFPPEYPDVCPTISLEDLEEDEGSLSEQEEVKVMRGLEEVVREFGLIYFNRLDDRPGQRKSRNGHDLYLSDARTRTTFHHITGSDEEKEP